MKFAVEVTDLHLQLAVVMPVMLDAGAVNHRERAKRTPVFVPFPAHAMQEAVAIAQFLDQLAVSMPGAVKVVKLAVHFPDFRMDLTTAVVKPFYARLWQILKLTQLQPPLLLDVGMADFNSALPVKIPRVLQPVRLI